MPAGDEILQYPLQTLAVGFRRSRLGLGERQQNAVVVGIDKAVVDFLLFGLVILVLLVRPAGVFTRGEGTVERV